MGLHPEPGSGVIEHGCEPGRVAEAIVHAVAVAVDADPLSIEPLYESVDPDAVEALVRHGGRTVTVSFEHHGVPLEVRGDGTIRVESRPGC